MFHGRLPAATACVCCFAASIAVISLLSQNPAAPLTPPPTPNTPPLLTRRRGLDTSCPTPLGFDLDVDEYASKTPVTHLVFTVHGIGQNLPYTSTVWSDSNALRRRMVRGVGVE